MNHYQKSREIGTATVKAQKRHITGSFSEHWHEFFEIEYIIKGTGTYIVDGKSYPIKENMLFFMSPADFHALENCDAEIYNVMFTCSLCDTDTLFNLCAGVTTAAKEFSEKGGALIERLLDEIVSSEDSEYSAQLLRCVIHKLSLLLTTQKSNIGTHVRSAIVHIVENFRTNLTLCDVANFVGIAPAYLSAKFVNETGTNFKAYLDNLRFDYALKLLEFTDMTVSEICVESGFSDYTNFMRRFKTRFSETPTEYRKKFTREN